MLRTTTLPQAAAGQPGVTKHDAAIARTLAYEWADRASRELCWPDEHGAVL